VSEQPLGTAAQEAARLAESLGHWLSARAEPRAEPGAPEDTSAGRRAAAEDTSAADLAPDGSTADGSAADGSAADGSATDGSAADGSAADGVPPVGHDPLTCRYCPLCRAMAAVQATSPQLVEQLARAADQVAAALHELAAGAGRPARTDPTPGPPRGDAAARSTTRRPSAAGQRPTSERIPVVPGASSTRAGGATGAEPGQSSEQEEDPWH
jgi:flagellar hook-length control protein FliK